MDCVVAILDVLSKRRRKWYWTNGLIMDEKKAMSQDFFSFFLQHI
jgi:hypothetical protein